VGDALVVVDPNVGITAADFVALWDADDQARAVGPAVVRPVSAGQYLPGLVELVAVPLAVNLVSNVLYDVVVRLIQRRRRGSALTSEVEVVQTMTGEGDQVVVVRVRRGV
jgi:hypothetical protein